jgi:HGF/MSP/plasminogen-like protein
MGQIWLDQVKCAGNEANLDKCLHWHWGEHNCGHAEDVGVRCSMAGTRQRISHDVEQVRPEVLQHERSGRILPTECGVVKVPDTPEPNFHFKVVRGTTAKKGFHPWQASIRAKKQAKSAHWCGAVLISRFHLLTAAHCLVGYPKGAYVIRMGDHLSDKLEDSEVEIYIENFYIHEDFRKGQHMNNDIAVVLLKHPVRFTDHIQPVCLPSKDTVYEAGRNCTISGWGATMSGSSSK